jgi:hypothetical protein
MEDFEFSDDFCRFIQSEIPAVDAAELLLVFHRRPEEAITIEEAMTKLGPGISAGDAAQYLNRFHGRGLLSSENGRFRYRKESELTAHVDKLALAYVQRPVTLIRVIYAFRDSKIRSFAEAFKLRKG